MYKLCATQNPHDICRRYLLNGNATKRAIKEYQVSKTRKK